MNLQQQEAFYQMMTRLKTNSRVASWSNIEDVRITEMVNGLLVSKPSTTAKEPVVIDLQEYAKGKAPNCFCSYQ